MTRSSSFLTVLLATMLSLSALSAAQDSAQTNAPASGDSEQSPSVGFRVFQWRYQADDGSDRPLNVAVWYPAQPLQADDAEQSTVTYANGAVGLARQDAAPAPAGGPYPLIVWSHGYTGSAINYAYLCERLASRGYVVAAPDHNDPVFGMRIAGPVEDEDLPARRRQALADLVGDRDDFDHDRYGYRPMELALTIENMTAQSDSPPGPDAPLSGMIDPDRIGAGGHSMGGYTVLTRIGCLPTAADERIRAAVLHSPGTWMWQEADYQTVAVPTMYMLGEWEIGRRDEAFVATDLAFANTPAPAWHIGIARAGHMIFTDPRTPDSVPLGPLAGKIMADRLARADTIARYTCAMFDLTLKADDSDAVAAARSTLAEGDEWTCQFETKPAADDGAAE